MRKRSEKFSLSQYDKESEFAQRYPEKSKEIFGSDPGFCGLNAVFWIVVNVLMFIFAVYVCVMLIDSKYKWDRLSDQKTQFENLESTFLKYQKGDQKGEANGYVPLNELGKIPLIFLSLVSEEITLFLGCWNANTNDPIIVSSIGQGSEQYITCESGNTFLNGINEWFVFDLPSFIKELNSWIKFEGTVNKIESQEPVDSQEIEIFSQGTGPLFDIKTLRGSTNINVTKTNTSTIIVEAPSQVFAETNLVNEIPVPFGSVSAISQGVGPDIELRSITSDNNAQQELNNTIVINFLDSYGRASGSAATFSFPLSSNIIFFDSGLCYYSRVGNVLYISQNLRTDISSTPYNATVRFDLSLSPEENINRFDNIDLATGYVTGYSISNIVGVNRQNTAGFCYKGSSTVVICRFAGSQSAIPPPGTAVVFLTVFIAVKLS